MSDMEKNTDQVTNNDDPIKMESSGEEQLDQATQDANENNAEATDEETSDVDASDNAVSESAEPNTMESIAEIMLDSADAANLAAETANASSELIINSVAEFNETIAAVQKKQYVTFWAFSALMLVGLAVGAVLLERLTASALQADEIMLTVGKRVVQMDADVKRMDGLRKELDELNETHQMLAIQISDSIYTMKGFEEKAVARQEKAEENTLQLLEKLSGRVGVNFDKFLLDNKKLKEEVNKNSVSLAKVGDELEELSIRVNEMRDQELVKKLEALITLEQNRYYEALKPKTSITAGKSSEVKVDKNNQEECVPQLGVPCK